MEALKLVKVPKEYTFFDFVLEKYSDQIHEGRKSANGDGARYYDDRQYLEDQDLDEEINNCGGDAEEDRKEFQADQNAELIKSWMTSTS